ncbi:MAG: efflux RND transporter permease subunit, partial [Planctomycetota bacterium]
EREAAECERLLLSPLPAAEERILQDPLNLFEDVFLPVMQRRTQGAKIDLETGHTLSGDGRAALLQVFGKKSPRDVEYARRFTAALWAGVDALYEDGRFSRDRLRVGVTGGYPVAVENERSVKRNLIVSCVGAFAGVLLLFMVVFRSLRVNVTVGLPLAVGVSGAFGAAAVALGFRMTAVAAAFGAILVGLGIDFPIHLYHRFRQETASGRGSEEAVRRALGRTGPGVLSAGLTTALAFGLLAFAGFRGMVEVGWFVGLGMIVILAVMITLLPALFVILEGGRAGGGGERVGLRWLTRVHEKRGGLLLGVGIVVALAAGLDVALRGSAPFEENVRALKTPSPESDEANEAIGAHFGLSLNPLLAVVRAPTKDAALSRAADVDGLLEGLIGDEGAASILGPGAYLPGPRRTERARKRMAGIDPEEVLNRLANTLRKHDLYEDPEPFEPSFDRLRKALNVAVGREEPRIPEGGMEALLAPFLAVDEGDFLAVTALYFPLLAGEEIHRKTGAEVRRLAAPGLGERGVVTSVDLLVHRLKDRVLRELLSITGFVALAVVLVALLHFRHLLQALFSLVPCVAGFCLTLSVMKLTGIDLNFMNVVVFPVILGIGVDDGIHFVHRWREKEGGDWRAALEGAGMPIVMTSLTSMVGFGSLVLADNPGLRSLGWVAILGLAACMVSTLTILPPLCRLAEGKKERKL